MNVPARTLLTTVALVAAGTLAACGGPATTTSATSADGGASPDGDTGSVAAPAGDPTPATGADATALPSAIECGTQYRPDVEVITGAEEPTLRVERGGGLMGATETLTFATMALQVTYVDEQPEGRSVTVDVRNATGDVLVRTLYQLPAMDLASIDFAGGHGFTGLQYVSNGTAQLQVWCTAVP